MSRWPSVWAFFLKHNLKEEQTIMHFSTQLMIAVVYGMLTTVAVSVGNDMATIIIMASLLLRNPVSRAFKTTQHEQARNVTVILSTLTFMSLAVRLSLLVSGTTEGLFPEIIVNITNIIVFVSAEVIPIAEYIISRPERTAE